MEHEHSFRTASLACLSLGHLTLIIHNKIIIVIILFIIINYP